ncbi:MAG TPA: NAD(P)H-binding protein, partial [Rubrobacter sp.]|nr:NAD(P)H-binding protein [Rubrobacter sp.]
SSPFRKARQVDVEGTGRLIEAATRAGVSHLVYISIVGIDRAASYPYYRIKLETERVVESSPVPYTILRATQFHDLVLMAMRFLNRFPVMPIPKGFLGQPIDAGEVAGRMVEIALSGPAGRVPDIGGPEVRTMADAARAYLEITGRRRRILEVPFPGKTARAFREGALVCPDRAYGKIRWEGFLRSEMGARMSLHGAEGVAR